MNVRPAPTPECGFAPYAPTHAPLPTLAEIEAAATLIYHHMPATPQYRWPLVDELAGTEVWIKHENHTPVGAFKIRGGIVYLDRLLREQPQVKGVVGATRGNHGQSMGFAARIAGIPAVVVVPRGNSPEKNAAMDALGVELIVHGADFQEACERADQIAIEREMHRLPSMASELVCGVATYCLEFLRNTPELHTVYVPIGMGSGACAMIAARNALGLATRVVGVVSTGAPAYQLSFAAGYPIEHAVTTILADGMACRSPNAEALAALIGTPHQPGLERVVAVSEDEVANAMRALFTATHNAAEGAGAASFAALMQEREHQKGNRIGVVLCGGNVDAEVFAQILTTA
jgi:threonine dehydratase